MKKQKTKTAAPRRYVNPITKDEIRKLILERSLTLTDVIDVVAELNGFVGVGFITFAESISDYIREMPKRRKAIAK